MSKRVGLAFPKKEAAKKGVPEKDVKKEPAKKAESNDK